MHPNRQPKGIPTGGQFAASQKTEAGLDLDVYDDPDECVSIGAHLDSVDDDGYCNHCGHSDPNPLDDRHGVSAAYPNGRCTGCGCGVDEQGRCYQADCAQFDETSPHAGYDDIDGSGADVPTGTTPVTALREGDRVRFEDGSVSEVTSLDGDHKSVSVEFDHDPTTIASYAHEETFEVLGATHDPTPSAGAGAGAGAGPGSRPEHKIIDPDHKDRCLGYAAAYADPPAALHPDPLLVDYGPTTTRRAGALRVGDRLDTGCVVMRLERRDGAVAVFVDGEDDWAFRVSEDHPLQVHQGLVDWTDPDWFEVEVHRIVVDGEARNWPVHEEDVREQITRSTQPRNLSPANANMTNRANGRAKVGDNVVFDQPMHGQSAYEVLGKMHRVDIAGHDGTKVVWEQTREVEYVLKDLATGQQTVSSLTGPGWRRIPAPGDHGPAAERAAVR